MIELNRQLWEVCFFVCVTLILLVPKPALSEDPFQIKLNNPIKYEYKFIGLYNDPIRDTLDIEKVNERKIKFRICTVDDHARVCELSNEAYAGKGNRNDFVFVYGKYCRLHFKMSGDAESIVTFDVDDRCRERFCTGSFSGIPFKRVK